jgi:hypothetical protein
MLTIAPPWVRSSLLVVFFLVVGARMTEAQPLTLAWDPSQDTHVTGYTLAIGSQPGQYTQQIDVGLTTEYTFASLAAGTYYFAVRAYSAGGLSSGYSNEVSATIPPVLLAPAPVVSCATPDPFASLGGGTCYNGGWLPPGFPVPGTTQAPASVSPPPAPPASSATGCATPDPFAGMGGGTCYNGGWLPPGMPVPGGSSPAAPPPPSSGPAPAPVPQDACRMLDPGSLCRDGRRHLLQRRLAAARHAGSRGEQPCSTASGAGTAAVLRAGASAGPAGACHMLDAGSLCRDGRRHLLQQRLAAAWHAGSRRHGRASAPGT